MTKLKLRVAQTVKRVYLLCRRPRFDPWVRKIPCRRERQPTAVFLPGESHGQRSRAVIVHGAAKRHDCSHLA